MVPKRQLSVPCLELCGALAGAQLAQHIQIELSITFHHTTLWTDFTTVLEWLQSEACHFKVFVGVRVAEIQEFTDHHSWHYVDFSNNPADDITKGKTLVDLSQPNQWRNGTTFLKQPHDSWLTWLKKTQFSQAPLNLGVPLSVAGQPSKPRVHYSTSLRTLCGKS